MNLLEAKYLCSSDVVLPSIFQVQLDSVLLNFQTLHHLFFILCKLLKEGNSSTQTKVDVTDISKISSHGGFLKQPVFDSSPTDAGRHSSIVSSILWKKFSCLLSQAAWPSILKCLDGGKTFIDYTVSQVTILCFSFRCLFFSFYVNCLGSVLFCICAHRSLEHFLCIL